MGIQVARMGKKKNTRFTWEREQLEEVGMR